MTPADALRRYRFVLGFFIIALAASGLTAFPLQHELGWLVSWRGVAELAPAQAPTALDAWLLTVQAGLRTTYQQFPWMAYGTDWLAFAHIVLAIFFIGPWRDPVCNRWVIQAGLIACALVLPLALVCGPLRGIPFGWRLIDCSFGVFGALPLWYCLRLTRTLQSAPE